MEVSSSRLARMFILLSALSTFASPVKGEDRTERYPSFTRLLTLHYNGPGANNATRQSLIQSYGNCRNLDRNAGKMVQFFESFGIDLTIPKQDPFKAYFLPDYDLQPWDVEHKALLGSYYEFGEFLNAPVYRSSWRLVAKKNFDVEQGIVANGSALHFGLFRIVLPWREVCIDYQSASPGVPVDDGFYRFQTFHFDLFSETWGRGLAQGILRNRPERKTLNWVLTFPPEGLP